MNERMGMTTTRKAIIIIGSLITLLALILAFVLFWEGEPKEMRAEANKFSPPASWKLESESTEPQRIVCLGDNACPSLDRHWIIPKNIQYSDISTLFKNAKWNNITEDTCKDMDAKIQNKSFSCSISVSLPKYDIQFYLDRADNSQALINASLFVNP